MCSKDRLSESASITLRWLIDWLTDHGKNHFSFRFCVGALQLHCRNAREERISPAFWNCQSKSDLKRLFLMGFYYMFSDLNLKLRSSFTIASGSIQRAHCRSVQHGGWTWLYLHHRQENRCRPCSSRNWKDHQRSGTRFRFCFSQDASRPLIDWLAEYFVVFPLLSHASSELVKYDWLIDWLTDQVLRVFHSVLVLFLFV